MSNNSSNNLNKKRMMYISFLFGFIVAFAVAYYWYNRGSDEGQDRETEATADEVMEQEATDTKPADNTLLSNGEKTKPTAEQPADLAGNQKSKPTTEEPADLGSTLIDRLFSDSEGIRKAAKNALGKKFHNDPAVIAKLIKVCSEEFDLGSAERNDNAIFQGIDVFSMVAEKNPATLRQHKDALYAFFDKTKGQYREQTQVRIDKVKELIDNE